MLSPVAGDVILGMLVTALPLVATCLVVQVCIIHGLGTVALFRKGTCAFQ